MAISQSYFFCRAWRLSRNKSLLPVVLFVITIGFEVTVGEMSYFLNLYLRTEKQSRIPETSQFLSVHLALIAILDLAVTIGFIIRLQSLKSSLRRGDAVIRQILAQTVVSNIIFASLALTTLL